MKKIQIKTVKPKEVHIKFNTVKISSEENLLYDKFFTIRGSIRYNGYTEMNQFVIDNIHSILSMAVNKNAKALQIITDPDFLISLDTLDPSPIRIREDINKFNCIYRSYIINPKKNVIYNPEVVSTLYKIAFKLNYQLICKLESLHIDQKDAIWLAVNRYSSTDERRNIRRMVRVMQHMPSHIMNEQMVIDIFSKTFNNQFMNLFITVMMDKFDSFDSEDEKYVYSTVSNALLDILNTMDFEDIKDIILEYQNELQISNLSGRFSLKSINSENYKNICNVIDYLESNGYKIKK